MAFRDEYDRTAVTRAFLLVLLAGACTGIGAMAVFFPRLVRLASKRTLAASLGLSAGVMLYVSMQDIFRKAQDSFESSDHHPKDASIYATLCFFLGMFVMMSVNHMVERLLGQTADLNEIFDTFDASKAGGGGNRRNNGNEEEEDEDDNEYDDDIESNYDTTTQSELYDEAQRRALQNMGIATAMAISIHNFPEGLVTFAGYMADPTVGTVLAMGIGMHNIPEGLCVAMPIYYATNNRLKGFLWAMLSGASEPLGALIGYFAIGDEFSGNANGVLFGLVAGIMAYLAIDELLPCAIRYDPENTVVTWSVIAGMMAIAVSVMLFDIS